MKAVMTDLVARFLSDQHVVGGKSVHDLDPSYLELPPSRASARTVRGDADRTLEAALAPTGQQVRE